MKLTVPCIQDRIIQQCFKQVLEPIAEAHFYKHSYGFRPLRSAHHALARVQTLINQTDLHYVVNIDILGFFDNVNHTLLIKQLWNMGIQDKKVLACISKMLKAEIDGEGRPTKGTPQGVISPVLANLFMHYTFDKWMVKAHPKNPWARYADDAVVHCGTKEEAEQLLEQLRERFKSCKLELHPEKTRIVYCKDDDRKEDYSKIKFDFLGYTFRPRRSKNRYGKFFINFTPGVSNKASKAMRQTIRGWRMHLKPDKEISDLSKMFNASIRGWINYYGHFYKSQMYPILHHMNEALVKWARRKYKKLERHKTKAIRWLGRLAKNLPQLFAHWRLGILPAAG